MKFALFFATMFFYCLAHAQDVGPSKLVLGGSTGYFSNNYSHTDSAGVKYVEYYLRQLSLNAYIGYRPNEKWLLGLQGGVVSGYSWQNYPVTNNVSESTTTTYSVGLFARRYFWVGKPLQFFLEPGTSYSTSKEVNTRPLIVAGKFFITQEFSAFVSPGISWAATKRFSFLARFGRLSYFLRKYKDWSSGSDKYPYHYFNLRLNNETFFVGVEFKL